MKKYLGAIAFTLFGFIPKTVVAHCPLCTVGAGALAVLAASLGVSSIIVGILIGAFALALSLWFAKVIKKRYIPFQESIVVAVVFLGTVIPIMPLVQDYGPWYVSLFGEYGTVFHNTYTVNLFMFGALIGAVIILISPYISKSLVRMRGGFIPFQGMIITISLLVIASIFVQIVS